MATQADIKNLSEEKKRNLKVDVTKIPDLEIQIKSLIDNLSSKYSFAEFIAIKDYLAKIKETYYFELGDVINRDAVCNSEMNNHFIERNLKSKNPLGWFLPHDVWDENVASKLRDEIIKREGWHNKTISDAKERGVSDFIFSSKVSSGELQRAKEQLIVLGKLKLLTPHFDKIQNRIREFNNDQKNCGKIVSKLMLELFKAKEKKFAIERYEAKHGKTQAKAAAADNKTRNRASELKKLVSKTNNCPYCGLILGEKPHLDHIYPVSKGGLSITENLVWCCAKCNSEKTDKGLLEFLNMKKFDITIVVQRLHSMNKHV